MSNQTAAAITAMTATPIPTPIPAFAPVDRDTPLFSVALVLMVALGAVFVEAMLADVAETELDEPLVEAVGFPVVVVELVVGAVRAINTLGVKTHELAEGLAELSDEKVSFNTATLILVRVS